MIKMNMMNDKEKIQKLIDEFYKILSGRRGEKRDWNSFRALFYKNARLIPFQSSKVYDYEIKSYDIDTYIFKLENFLSVSDFYEYGFDYSIECFEDVAQVRSLYEAKIKKADKKPVKNGINLVQLINDGVQWKITNMMWMDSSVHV